MKPTKEQISIVIKQAFETLSEKYEVTPEEILEHIDNGNATLLNNLCVLMKYGFEIMGFDIPELNFETVSKAALNALARVKG